MAMFFSSLSVLVPKNTLPHKQVVLVGCKENKLLMGIGSRTVSVVVMLSFDVQAKVSTGDHRVGHEEDVDRIVNTHTSSYDLGIVVVKIGLKEVNVAYDGGAIHCDLPQI